MEADVTEIPEGVTEAVPLNNHCTFRTGGCARFFGHVKTIGQLREMVRFSRLQQLPLFVLGHGSNVLISDEGFPGLVVKLGMDSICVLRRSLQFIDVRVEAGCCWDDLVAHAVERGWWGIENLSGIPGTVGAFPVQNVGAYGQDAASVVKRVEVLDIENDVVCTIDGSACGFGYRSSIFNREQKGRYIILAVVFRFPTFGRPQLGYYSIRDRYLKRKRARGRGSWLLSRYLMSPLGVYWASDLLLLREIVLEVRGSGCLPDLKSYGNAGSFFQAAYVGASQVMELKKLLATQGISAEEVEGNLYGEEDGIWKVSPAWLLRLAGMSNAVRGGAAVYERNPAILINRSGAASSRELFELACHVCRRVFDATGLRLRIEPELLGFPERIDDGDLLSLCERMSVT